MNTEMKAAAQVIATAKAAVSEGGRLTRDLYWDNHFDFESQVIIPVKVFEALAEAVDDYEGLAELSLDESEDGPSRIQRFMRTCRG